MQCCRTKVQYKQYDSMGGGGVCSLVNLENNSFCYGKGKFQDAKYCFY
jgi:hypothetical protein